MIDFSKRYSIVGAERLGTQDAVATEIKEGAAALLIREPDNAFDPNAIMVWVDDRHVGYLAGKQIKELAPYIDANGVTSNPYPDYEMNKAVQATFLRSDNSRFPMVRLKHV